MKSCFKIFFSLSIVILLFSSCGKNNGAGNMIPGDALFVVQVNTKSLDSKLSWDEIKQTDWYKEKYADTSVTEWQKKILDNPSASGIDFDEGLTFFVTKGTGNDYYLAAEGKLKNNKDFEQFNKNVDASQTVKKEGDINLFTLKDKSVVGWNSDHFVYVTNPGNPSSQMYQWDDSSNLQNAPSTVDKSGELSAFCKKLFSLKSDSSLAKNKKFASLLTESGDIRVWQNTEAMIKSSPSMGMLGMLKLDAFLKDNISTYTVNFDKGKIDIDQKGYVSKELGDVLKKYMGGSVNTGMIKNIPSQDVLGVLSLNFKPEGLVELIKLTGTDGLINSYAQESGFSLDDVSKATNGDLLLAFTDFKISQDSGKLNPTGFNYIFSVGIGDKASLQKIIDAATKVTSQFGKDSLVNYVMNDKTFALSNTNTFANQYLSGNSNNKYDFTDQFSGHPAGFFLDIHKLLSSFSSLDRGTQDHKAMLDESLKMWNNIIASGGDFKDNAYTFHTEINLINKDTNSLKQLNHYFNEMYKLEEAQKKESTRTLDSLLVPPPIDTVKVK